MIADFFLNFIMAGVETVVGWLPTGTLGDLPGVTEIMTWVAKVNSVVPIGPVLQTAFVILGAVAIFVVVRMALVVWNLIYP